MPLIVANAAIETGAPWKGSHMSAQLVDGRGGSVSQVGAQASAARLNPCAVNRTSVSIAACTEPSGASHTPQLRPTPSPTALHASVKPQRISFQPSPPIANSLSELVLPPPSSDVTPSATVPSALPRDPAASATAAMQQTPYFTQRLHSPLLSMMDSAMSAHLTSPLYGNPGLPIVPGCELPTWSGVYSPASSRSPSSGGAHLGLTTGSTTTTASSNFTPANTVHTAAPTGPFYSLAGRAYAFHRHWSDAAMRLEAEALNYSLVTTSSAAPPRGASQAPTQSHGPFSPYTVEGANDRGPHTPSVPVGHTSSPSPTTPSIPPTYSPWGDALALSESQSLALLPCHCQHDVLMQLASIQQRLRLHHEYYRAALALAASGSSLTDPSAATPLCRVPASTQPPPPPNAPALPVFTVPPPPPRPAPRPTAGDPSEAPSFQRMRPPALPPVTRDEVQMAMTAFPGGRWRHDPYSMRVLFADDDEPAPAPPPRADAKDTDGSTLTAKPPSMCEPAQIDPHRGIGCSTPLHGGVRNVAATPAVCTPVSHGRRGDTGSETADNGTASDAAYVQYPSRRPLPDGHRLVTSRRGGSKRPPADYCVGGTGEWGEDNHTSSSTVCAPDTPVRGATSSAADSAATPTTPPRKAVTETEALTTPKRTPHNRGSRARLDTDRDGEESSQPSERRRCRRRASPAESTRGGASTSTRTIASSACTEEPSTISQISTDASADTPPSHAPTRVVSSGGRPPSSAPEVRGVTAGPHAGSQRTHSENPSSRAPRSVEIPPPKSAQVRIGLVLAPPGVTESAANPPHELPASAHQAGHPPNLTAPALCGATANAELSLPPPPIYRPYAPPAAPQFASRRHSWDDDMYATVTASSLKMMAVSTWEHILPFLFADAEAARLSRAANHGACTQSSCGYGRHAFQRSSRLPQGTMSGTVNRDSTGENTNPDEAVAAVADAEPIDLITITCVVQLRHRCRFSVCAASVVYTCGELVVADGDMGLDIGVVATVWSREAYEAMSPEDCEAAGLPKRLSQFSQARIYRRATPCEVDWYTNEKPMLESHALYFLQQLHTQRHLFHTCRVERMSFVACELQADMRKVYVYYDSSNEVRFLELATFLNGIFRCRIWIHRVHGGKQLGMASWPSEGMPAPIVGVGAAAHETVVGH